MIRLKHCLILLLIYKLFTMPSDALIAGGANVTSSLINAASSSIQNKRQRKFTEYLYDKQYKDNLDFWNMQNEYNSPLQQVARLQEAGLNPALIYGQSSGGAAGTAGSIRSPEAKMPEFRTPQWGDVFGSIIPTISQLYDIEAKKQTIDNLKEDNKVKKQDALLKAAQVVATGVNTARSEFDLNFEKSLVDISAQARKEALRQTKTQTDLSMKKDEREAAKNSSDLAEAAERILTMRIGRSATRSTIKGRNLDNTLKQMDIDLRKMGINPNSSMWAQIVGRVVDAILKTDGKKSAGKGLMDVIRGNLNLGWNPNKF